MARAAQAQHEDDTGTEPESAGPITEARERALVLARTGADDDEVLAALRAEYSASRPAKIQPKVLGRCFERWKADLKDARVAGHLAVLHRLQAIATDGDPRVAVPAGVYLARRLEPPVEQNLEKRLRELRKMSPKQLRSHAAKMAGGR